VPQPPWFPVSGVELREPQPDDSCTELLFPPWAPQPEFSVPRFEDCGGVNVRHPDRDGCSEGEPPPRFETVPCDEDRFHGPLFLPAPNDDSSRIEWFPKPLPARNDEKKCCEPDGAFRKDDGSAPRPAAL